MLMRHNSLLEHHWCAPNALLESNARGQAVEEGSRAKYVTFLLVSRRLLCFSLVAIFVMVTQLKSCLNRRMEEKV